MYYISGNGGFSWRLNSRYNLYTKIERFVVTFDLGVNLNRTGGGELSQVLDDGENAILPIFEIDEGWSFLSWDNSHENINENRIISAIIEEMDTDGDGLTDNSELNIHFTDPNEDDTLLDDDNDGLNNYEEIITYGTSHTNSDSDGDSLTDSEEINTYETNPNNSDSDGDSLIDGEEINTYLTNPNNVDTDNDSLMDRDEVFAHQTNPNNADSDGDSLMDGEEIITYLTDPNNTDSDGDSLTDSEEIITYQTNPNNTDSDGDSLTDSEEIITYQTNPNNSDSDLDQISDYAEINTYFTNPNDVDSDDDGILDGVEINGYGTDPLSEDTSNDGFSDGFLIAESLDPTIDHSALRTRVLNQMKDLRVGSTMLEVTDGQADITMTLEETEEVDDWSNAVSSEKTIQVDATTGTRFYRFKMTD
jgi:hypothetical protein